MAVDEIISQLRPVVNDLRLDGVGLTPDKLENSPGRSTIWTRMRVAYVFGRDASDARLLFSDLTCKDSAAHTVYLYASKEE